MLGFPLLLRKVAGPADAVGGSQEGRDMKSLRVLLVVGVVLLAVDIAMRVSPREATAQEPEIRIFPEPPVRLVAAFGTFTATNFNVRLWSDGVIEEFDPEAGVPDWAEVSGGAYTPPAQVRAVSLSGGDGLLIRAWSDGTVEKLSRNNDSVPWDTSQWAIVGP